MHREEKDIIYKAIVRMEVTLEGRRGLCPSPGRARTHGCPAAGHWPFLGEQEDSARGLKCVELKGVSGQSCGRQDRGSLCADTEAWEGLRGPGGWLQIGPSQLLRPPWCSVPNKQCLHPPPLRSWLACGAAATVSLAL